MRGVQAQNDTDRRYWHVAAGDAIRNHASICLDWDVILLGPGNNGLWPVARLRMKEKGMSAQRINEIATFNEVVKSGDLVALRVGLSKVYAVGEVVGPSLWFDGFGDVDGWDLQYVRRVYWHWKCPAGKPINKFKFARGGTLGRAKPEVAKWMRSCVGSVKPTHDDLRRFDVSLMGEMNKPMDDIEINDVANYFFDKGVDFRRIEDLKKVLVRLTSLAKWYDRQEKDGQANASEYEGVSHFVVPLLQELGWTPQLLSVEWNRIDVAGFASVPRCKESLKMVVEAKRRKSSCLSAFSQAKDYVEKKGAERCDRLVVTDGMRFGVFLRRADGTFGSYPDAYLNLARLRRAYPIYDHAAGAAEALYLMSTYSDTSALRADK